MHFLRYWIWNKEVEKKFNSDSLNPLSANPIKWSNTLKQFLGNLPTNCLSVFDHFVKLALKGLKTLIHRRSQWSGFYIIGTSVMKELMHI